MKSWVSHFSVLATFFSAFFNALLSTIILLSSTLLLGACSLSNAKNDNGKPVVVENHSMLQDQQATLADHAERLNSLSQAQETLLYTLSQLRSDVSELSHQLAKVAKSSADVPKPRAKLVTKDLKLVKTADEVKASDKAIIGRIEYVWLGNAEGYVRARIDTGIRSSTLSVADIQRFERNGAPWVRFELQLEDDKQQVLEVPLQRQAKTKQGAESSAEGKPVVRLGLRLGEIRESADIVLVEKSDSSYPLLLGRSFLQDIAVVDVARKFTRSKDPSLMKKAKPE